MTEYDFGIPVARLGSKNDMFTHEDMGPLVFTKEAPTDSDLSR